MFASLKHVSSLLVSTYLLMVGFGVAGYLTPLRGLAEGWSTLTISLIATAYSAGFACASIITPLIVRRVGHIRVFAAFVGVLLVAILGAAMVVDWGAWLIFRGLTGFAMAGVYIVIETWMNERASNEYRGALFSFYMSTTTMGAVSGQFIVPFGSLEGTGLFIIAAICYAVAIFPIALSVAPTPGPLTQIKINLPKLWQRTPVAFIGSIITGVIGGAWLSMAAVYATKSGMDATGGAQLQAAVIFGSLVLQIPIGRLSDLIDRRIVMVMASIIGVASSIAMALIPIENALAYHFAAFMMGSVLYPIYALNIAHANDLAEPGEYVQVSSGLMVLYSAGVIVGPLLAGVAMEAFGAMGLPYLLVAGFGAYGLYAGWRILRRRSTLPSAEKGDYQAVSGPLQGTPSQAALEASR